MNANSESASCTETTRWKSIAVILLGMGILGSMAMSTFLAVAPASPESELPYPASEFRAELRWSWDGRDMPIEVETKQGPHERPEAIVHRAGQILDAARDTFPDG